MPLRLSCMADFPAISSLFLMLLKFIYEKNVWIALIIPTLYWGPKCDKEANPLRETLEDPEKEVDNLKD